MIPRTRRSTLRLGAGIVAATALAGCADDVAEEVLPSAADGGSESGSGTDGSADDGPPFPGVEDGVVTRVEHLGEAHEEALRTRTGTLVETYADVDPIEGEATTTMSRVSVDGDRLHAAIAPVESDADDPRREFYAADGETWLATFEDGEATLADPDEHVVTEHDLLGRGPIQDALWEASVVGTTAEHDDRYVVRREARDDGTVAWTETTAIVDADGLVHRFSHAADADARSEENADEAPRHRRDLRLTELGETTVERPEWVGEG